MKKLYLRKQRGITILALTITIIILLILAGITIVALTGENGLIKNVDQAKEETEIATEKEIVNNATVQAVGSNNRGTLDEKELQEELDNITGNDVTKVKIIRHKTIVEFTESQRMYYVDENGNVFEYIYTDLPIMENGQDFNNRMSDYKEKILTVTVLNNIDVPENVYQVFDVSKEQNETVKAWLIENEENTGVYDLYIGGNEGVDIESCVKMFYEFSNCIKINLENLYTDKVSGFDAMFSFDTNLKEINLENIDTSKAVSMNTMFNKCNSLEYLDVSNFDTSNVTNMSAMFFVCVF